MPYTVEPHGNRFQVVCHRHNVSTPLWPTYATEDTAKKRCAVLTKRDGELQETIKLVRSGRTPAEVQQDRNRRLGR